MNDHAAAVITQEGLAGLIEALRSDGFRVIGPRLRDQAIVYDDIESVADLPAGWTDEQEGGHYRVRKREDAALFLLSQMRLPDEDTDEEFELPQLLRVAELVQVWHTVIDMHMKTHHGPDNG